MQQVGQGAVVCSQTAAIEVLAVRSRVGLQDSAEGLLQGTLRDLGLAGPVGRSQRLYLWRGANRAEARPVAERLCVDPLLEEVLFAPVSAADWVIDVCLRPGVTDTEGDALATALAVEGLPGLTVRTAQRYLLSACLDAAIVRAIAAIITNPVIQVARAYPPGEPPGAGEWQQAFAAVAGPDETVETVALRGLEQVALVRLSRERLLALATEDLLVIRDHYRGLGRDPTDVELETLAQTWSEHCAHRTFKATIRHREPSASGETVTEIRGLLGQYLVAATERVKRPWVLSAFKDNPGLIAFDRRYALAIKVETHNHPSALEPFGGANTGVGGVVRDVLGVSAEPIANTDVLCFGPLDLPPADLPPGALHPRRVYRGVVAGVADYGNKLGIPTVNGAVLFDPGYTGNPLVFCGTVGLLPRDSHPTQPAPGDLIVVAGGRTGRDGLHGATFSSEVLDPSETAALGSVVQIGDPIVEKRLADALPQARDQGLYSAITDCGAGGLSSAVGELASELGARVELAELPLKYPGLRPWEIWLSEAQERMVLAVPPAKLGRLQALFAAEGVESTAIGQFSGDGRLRVHYNSVVVADLDCHFLHRGMPIRELESVFVGPGGGPVAQPGPRSAGQPHDLTPWLERALADPNVASKEPIVRRYDHEVQARTVGKPFVGPNGAGPADAAVLRVLPTSQRGVAIGCGINPRYGQLDPRAMALLAVDEALRNVVAVGADPDRTAILDNFCWGNPNLPDRLGGLVRAAQGCYEAAVGFRVPFVSGKDSLNNEFRAADGSTQPIPGTLLITALGIVPDLARTVSLVLKAPGDLIYLVGSTADELGGSLLLKLRGELGQAAPRVVLRRARATLRGLHRAIRSGLVQACHDLSEGGLAVAAAEMAIAGHLGLALDSRRVVTAGSIDQAEVLLFSESASRFLVEVRPEHAAAFERQFGPGLVGCIGRVQAEPHFEILGLTGQPRVDAEVAHLRQVWQRPLQEAEGW